MHQLFLSDDPIAGGGNLRVKLPLVAPSSQFGSNREWTTTGGLLGGLRNQGYTNFGSGTVPKNLKHGIVQEYYS